MFMLKPNSITHSSNQLQRFIC